MTRLLAIELTMMVMLEKEEGSYEATLREIEEETGLVIQPVLRGTAEWNNLAKETRELAFLYTATVKKRTVPKDLFWVKKTDLNTHKLADTLTELLPIFFGEEQQIYFDV